MTHKKTKEIFIEIEIIRVTKKRPAQKKSQEPKQNITFESGKRDNSPTKHGKFSGWFFDTFLWKT